MKELQFNSYAKLNLCLYVGQKEANYHPIRSIFCEIDLFDECFVKPSLTSNHHITFLNEEVPLNNTCEKAMSKLSPHLSQFFWVTIKKRIPLGSGLGGGSSNAAYLIKTLNHKLKLNLDHNYLSDIALSIGSDTPYFLKGGFCEVSGIGETVQELEPVPSLFFVLILPNIQCSSKDVYSCFDSIGIHDNINNMDMNINACLGINSLEKATLQLYPELMSLKRKAEHVLEKTVYLSGSGSTLYIIAHNKEEQDVIYKKLLPELNVRLLKCKPIIAGTEGRT